MKNKKIKSFICFLLCFVLLFSFPFNTTAHALAVESYLIYAIITGLAAMGFTFTVAGGVDAMIQAMEEKVDDYQKQGEIIDFYEVMRRNIKMVPSPSGGTDPDGNDLFNLLYNATAWDALEKFVDWLTSDGGWVEGYNGSINTITFEANINGSDTVAFTSDVTLVEEITPSTKTYYKFQINSLGTFLPFDFDGDPYYIYTDQFYTVVNNQVSKFVGYNLPYSTDYELNLNYQQGSTFHNLRLNAPLNVFGYGSGAEAFRNNATGLNFINYNNELYVALVTNDNYCLLLNRYAWNVNPVQLSSTVDVITPEELEKQFPEVNQGVIMQQLEIGSPEIQEWARQVEELFNETGTIPQPQPEVITDPDYAPQPTPVPTPVPSPEIEDIDDLGLPQLGEALFNKFPFSLPKDIARVFTILHADPVTPYWEVDLTGEALGISSNFVIDFAEYEILGQICRWFSVISFCLFLIIITKGMIGW